MADSHAQGVVETGAKMDYEEHERTYAFFVKFAKYSILVVAAILISMAFGFFTTAGFFSSLLLFLLITAAGAWLLR
ncbi:aa3-type cytochrome c oxidase subunit IV [Chelativorans composti]|jgi:Bacterial aa3 type cytochrome c oxidase subunit IV.|uniref:Aa3-type cytochrome c oxidase subunit IV n=1 Tax=Chelativorans composti TaxID=768533 RepID=A0ABW5DCR0_9HYPH